jgi:hypothetical protein
MQQRFDYRLGQEIYLLLKSLRQALGYTQHPVLRVPGDNAREVKRSGGVKVTTTTTTPHLVLRLKMFGEVAPLPHSYVFMVCTGTSHFIMFILSNPSFLAYVAITF